MIRVVHPGSRIWMLTISHPESRIPDPGVKKAPNPGSRIPDPDPQHWVVPMQILYFFHFSTFLEVFHQQLFSEF